MISIILTEDNEDDRDFFVSALEDLNLPIELISTNDGVELMTTLRETVTEPPPPHVIFLDLNLPRKNGYECIREIRETTKLKDIPIVVISTTDSTNEVEKTYNQGANCYIKKPISHIDLKLMIEKALSLKLWDTRQQLTKEQFVLSADK
jgi:CheY-like chemotaxis protein